MSPIQEIGILLLQTLGSVYLMIIALRFLLQLARADFYNPISQFAVKATNPVLIPIRRAVSGIFGIDLASIVLALALQYLVIQLSGLILGFGVMNPVHVLAFGIVGCLSLVVSIYFWGLLAMIISSWVAPQSSHPALLLIHQLVEPLMKPFRKLMPDMGGIDISPIFAFLALNVVQVLIKHMTGAVIQMSGYGPRVVSLVMGI